MRERPGDETGYYGWTNWPTWAVNLHLTNEETLYRMTAGMDAAELKAAVEDHVATDNLLASDLLGWALGAVNWAEIAEALAED